MPLPMGEHYDPVRGGAIATVTRNLARELIAAGHQVTILTPTVSTDTYAEGDAIQTRWRDSNDLPWLSRKLRALNARRRGSRWPAQDAYLGATMRVIRKHPSDVYICANDPALATGLTRRHQTEQVVLWLHNLMESGLDTAMRRVPEGVRLIAVSRFVAEWTENQFTLPPGSVVVAHNGVDSGQFTPRIGYLDPRKPVRVVCHGRLDPNKGHEVAADAVAVLRAEGAEVTLTLIGGEQTFGWNEADLVDYRGRLAGALLAAHATSLGRVAADQVPALLREHDVACVLSRSDDPFPLTSVEAMASGCAIVGTRSGGIPEAIGNAGILVDKGSVAQVADALRVWARDPAALSGSKQRSRERAIGFSWKRTADVLLSALAEGIQ